MHGAPAGCCNDQSRSCAVDERKLLITRIGHQQRKKRLQPCEFSSVINVERTLARTTMKHGAANANRPAGRVHDKKNVTAVAKWTRYQVVLIARQICVLVNPHAFFV